VSGIDDDFSTNTIANYTITGGTLAVASGALAISGTTAGNRLAMHANWLNGDAGYVGFTLNSAATSTFSSCLWSMDDARTNYYGFHIVSGKMYVIKVVGGVQSDISTATTGITVTWASGDRVWARFNNDTIEIFQNQTLRFSTITNLGRNTGISLNVPHGIGHRRVGLKIERTGTTNSVACTRFEASDLLAPGGDWDIQDLLPGRTVGRQISVQRSSFY
jgi:uncharacterized protein (DUF697 family)